MTDSYMSGVKTKQSTGKQLVAMIFILALATKMFLQPLLLIKAAGRDAYIALAIDGVLDMIALVITLIAMLYSRDTDFFTLISSAVGRTGAKITVGLFGLFLIFKLDLSVAETVAFYSQNVLTDLDRSLLVMILLIFLVGVAVHTLRALTRLNELLAPVIVICLVILVAIVAATRFDLANIFPAMRAPDKFGSAVAHHLTWLGDFSPLMLFVGRTEIKKRTAVIGAAAGLIGTGMTVFFSLVMCAAFGNVPQLVDASTNLSSILQFSLGNVYGRLDLFSEILWSVASFIENALFFYAAARCIEFVIGRSRHLIVGIALGAIVFLSLFFVFGDPARLSAVAVNPISSAIVAAFTFGVPLFALACAVFKGRGRAETLLPVKERE